MLDQMHPGYQLGSFRLTEPISPFKTPLVSSDTGNKWIKLFRSLKEADSVQKEAFPPLWYTHFPMSDDTVWNVWWSPPPPNPLMSQITIPRSNKKKEFFTQTEFAFAQQRRLLLKEIQTKRLSVLNKFIKKSI